MIKLIYTNNKQDCDHEAIPVEPLMFFLILIQMTHCAPCLGMCLCSLHMGVTVNTYYQCSILDIITSFKQTHQVKVFFQIHH